MRLINTITIIGIFLVILVGCKNTEDLIDFTEDDEVLLGQRLSEAISTDSSFVLISPEGNEVSYAYVNSRLDEITTASSITKSEEFIWTVTLFEDESRQAFATPGGYIYVSTGLIFYLSNEDEFSGMLAHLIAHIDQSHISEMLFFEYGVNGLKSIATSGNAVQLSNIIEDLDLRGSYLRFSRANELAADTLAISLLSETDQSCQANGLYFDRALTVQPELISAYVDAHRLDSLRVNDLEEAVILLGCDVTIDDASSDRFRNYRNSLP